MSRNLLKTPCETLSLLHALRDVYFFFFCQEPSNLLFFDYFAKIVRIGGILALSDPHFCILSRDCFNLSREYFSLWAIKTSLDRNASAVLDPEVLFSCITRHLALLPFCKLQVGIFQRSVLFID